MFDALTVLTATSQSASAAGEVLAGIGEAVFTPRERAALAWTDALTRLPETGAPDDAYEAVARGFNPAEQVALTLAIVAINGWNRLAVGFRTPAGSYVSKRRQQPAAA